MLDNAVKVLRQRQQAVNAQLRRLQAEARKLDKALRVLAQMSEVVTAAAPQPARRHKKSAAGSQALAAGRIQWVIGDSQKEAATRTYQMSERDQRWAASKAEEAEHKSETLVPASQKIPCTCGGINTTCMYCAGTGMREPSE